MSKFTERDFKYLDHNLDKEITKRLRPLGLLNLFFLFFLIVSLILWIWLDWRMVLKMAGTAFSGLCVTAFIYHCFKKVIKNEVKKNLGDLTGPEPKNWNKSAFQLRIEEMQRNKSKTGCTDFCGNPECRQFCKEKVRTSTT